MIINVSKNFKNYSQKNNEISPHTSCGPTNMIQGLVYSGWNWDNNLLSELKQPEDKLTKFCRTNINVLNYYKLHYKNLYFNWIAEAERIANENGKELWEVDTINSYSPNEIHDVMNYATNLFIGYTAQEVENMEKETGKRPVVNFENYFNIGKVKYQLEIGLPVVTSVSFNGNGHYVTVVGFDNKKKTIIIDNTYGKFNFEKMRYENVPGDNEEIKEEVFLKMVKPVMHIFTPGVLTI